MCRMGQARIKQRAAFAPNLIEEWETNDCVDFAVALARITGWLLQVDWLSNSVEHQESITTDKLRPLRVHVADNSELVFDVRGVRSFFEYNERIIQPLATKMQLSGGGVYTRYYSEEGLTRQPLRVQPNEANIKRASEAIALNFHFLASIPQRNSPSLPADRAATFTYGRCAPYAEAMKELTGLTPVGLIAKRFSPRFEGTKRAASGYVHSVVIHPDGMAEDSWGKAPLSEIAGRFGVIEFSTSEEAHRSVVARLCHNSNDLYSAALHEAQELIRLHRL